MKMTSAQIKTIRSVYVDMMRFRGERTNRDELLEFMRGFQENLSTDGYVYNEFGRGSFSIAPDGEIYNDVID